MYLAHHYPDDYERCVLIGRSHVCRRCLVLYPIAFVVMVGTLAIHPGSGVDLAMIVLLPLPAVIELVLENVGVLTYDPRRQIAVTVPLAIGLGRGFAVYLGDNTSVSFWGPVIVYVAVTGGAVAWRHWREARAREA